MRCYIVYIQINSLHIFEQQWSSGRADIMYIFTETVFYTRRTQKWSPNECFSHLPISLLPDWSLPVKSALLNDKIVRSFDLCFSALS